MRFLLTLLIISGCAYKDQPSEIQKLKVEKIQSEEVSSNIDESVEVVDEEKPKKEYQYDSEEIIDNKQDDEWEFKLNEIRKKEYWCAEQVKDVSASKTGPLVVGIKNGECVFKNPLTEVIYSLEELLAL